MDETDDNERPVDLDGFTFTYDVSASASPAPDDFAFFGHPSRRQPDGTFWMSEDEFRRLVPEYDG
jgi:hypothetical protein